MIYGRLTTICGAALIAAGVAATAQAHDMGDHRGGSMMGNMGGQGPMMGGGGMGQQGHMMGQGGMSGGEGGAMGQRWMGDHLPQDLSADTVRHILGRHIAQMGNERLKVGNVTERDEDTIVAEIVTVDDSLVQRLVIDRHTGAARREAREQ